MSSGGLGAGVTGPGSAGPPMLHCRQTIVALFENGTGKAGEHGETMHVMRGREQKIMGDHRLCQSVGRVAQTGRRATRWTSEVRVNGSVRILSSTMESSFRFRWRKCARRSW